jgi:hypothetical protein
VVTITFAVEWIRVCHNPNTRMFRAFTALQHCHVVQSVVLLFARDRRWRHCAWRVGQSRAYWRFRFRFRLNGLKIVNCIDRLAVVFASTFFCLTKKLRA